MVSQKEGDLRLTAPGDNVKLWLSSQLHGSQRKFTNLRDEPELGFVFGCAPIHQTTFPQTQAPILVKLRHLADHQGQDDHQDEDCHDEP